MDNEKNWFNHNASECIEFCKIALKRFFNLKSIISEDDFQTWYLKLNEIDIQEYLCESDFNLLKAAIISGWRDKHQLFNPNINFANSLLAKTDFYINAFQYSENFDSFKHKKKNLGSSQFFPAISELSIAYYFQKKSYCISFEKKLLQISQLEQVRITLIEILICV